MTNVCATEGFSSSHLGRQQLGEGFGGRALDETPRIQALQHLAQGVRPVGTAGEGFGELGDGGGAEEIAGETRPEDDALMHWGRKESNTTERLN